MWRDAPYFQLFFVPRTKKENPTGRVKPYPFITVGRNSAALLEREGGGVADGRVTLHFALKKGL